MTNIFDLKKQLQKQDEDALKRLSSKYTCVICGNTEVTFATKQQNCFVRSNNGTAISHPVFDAAMVVCGELCRKQYIENSKIPYEILMTGVGVPARYRNARIEWWKPGTSLSDSLSGWIKDKKLRNSLFLWGPPGTGKSSMAAALALELRKQELKIKFMNANRLACDMNVQSIQGKDTNEFLQQYANYDVIILDDFAKHKLTDTAKTFFFQFFSDIYDDNRTLIITSNYMPEKVADNIDERLPSRLNEMCSVLQFSGKDMRKNGSKAKNTGE